MARTKSVKFVEVEVKVKEAAPESPAAERLRWPAKSETRYKRRDTVRVARPLVPDDYETIREQMAARHRHKLEVVTALGSLTEQVKKTKKELGELAKATEADLSVLATGEITETLPCLEIFDYGTGTVAKIDEATDRVYESREMWWGEKQRSMKFDPDPTEDCRACKYFSCREAGTDFCGDFRDCFDCPSRQCGRALTGLVCGFEGSRNNRVAGAAGEETVRGVRLLNWQKYQKKREELVAEDCGFCDGCQCGREGGASGCVAVGDPDGDPNCFHCDFFSCDSQERPKGCPKRIEGDDENNEPDDDDDDCYDNGDCCDDSDADTVASL